MTPYKTIPWVLLASLLSAAGSPAMAAEPAAAPAAAATPHPGKLVFDRYCGQCHAPGLGYPGTQQLGWTRGADKAVLEQRKDLVPEYVKLVVRQGLLEMPPVRPTEVSDQQLDQLADYLAPPRTARPGKRR